MMLRSQVKSPTCFFEQDAGAPLARRCLAEATGSALLMVAVSCSAIAVETAAPIDPTAGSVPALIASALAIAGVLVGLIVALGAVSGAHFNPLITILQWLAGERGAGCTFAYIAAQIAGATGGALAGVLLHGAVSAPPPASASVALALSEIVATTGLLIIVAGSARGDRPATGPFAVGGWIAGAVIALPSRCYANPAITLAAIVSSGPARLSGTLAGSYLLAQLAGLGIAFTVAAKLYPVRR